MHQNNFDLLRLIFACAVCFYHMGHLTSNEALSYAWELQAGLAVKGFFVLSGFLIFQSYANTDSLVSFFIKRARRIYPAYAALILICAFCGVFFSNLKYNDYYSKELAKYIISNLLFLNGLQPSLPGVFSSSQISTAVNGSLWTIKVEVLFYLSVPVVAWLCKKFNAIIVLLAIYFLSIAYSHVMQYITNISDNPVWAILKHQIPGQYCYFAAGALILFFKQHLSSIRLLLVSTAGICLIIAVYIESLMLLPLSISIVIFATAFWVPVIKCYPKNIDISYGMYIWHFPIIQASFSLGLFSRNYLLAGLGTFAVIVLFSLASWFLVEKWFFTKRFVQQS